MASALIGALRVHLGLDSAQFQAGAKRAQTTMQRFRQQMLMISGVVAAAGTGLALAIKGQLDAADAAGEAAQKLGLPVEDLTRLRHAAQMSGVGVEQLETGIRQLSKQMAANAPVLQQMGVAVRDSAGNMRPTADVLKDVAGVLATMPDGAEKTALAMKLFGKSGAELIPLLNQGKDGMAAMMAEADRLGLTIDQKTATAAGNFNDNLDRLRGAVRGLVVQMTAALAPALEQISDIAVRLANGFGELPEPVRQFAAGLAALLLVLTPLAVVAGLLATALGAISGPVLAVAAGCAALIAASWWLWKNFDLLKQALRDAMEAMRTLVEDGVRYVQQAFDELVTFVSEIPAKMVQFGRDTIQGFVDGLRERWNALKDSVRNIFSGEMTGIVVDELGIHSPSRVFRAIGRFVTDGFRLGIEDGAGDAVAAAGGMARDATAAAADSVSEIGDAGKAVQQTMGRVWSSIARGGRDLGDVFDDLRVRLMEIGLQASGNAFLAALLPGLFGAGGFAPLVASARGNAFGNGRLIPFASGGVVQRPTLFGMRGGMGLMGEAGAEGILPLERVGGKLGVNASGLGGGGTTVQVINTTGQPVREERSTGPDLRETVRIIVGEDIAQGRFDDALGTRIGARPVVRNRFRT